MITVRLNHAWRGANTGDVVTVDDQTGHRLTRSGAAIDTDQLLTHIGGGVYEVQLHNPIRRIRVRGHARALQALQDNHP